MKRGLVPQPGPQPTPEDPQALWRRHRRLVRLGQALMLVGVLVGLVHMLLHVAGSPSGWSDLTVGYPTAGLLVLAGAMLAGRAEPGRRHS